MTFFSHSIARPLPLARSIAMTALMSATMLAVPMTLARAETGANAVFWLAQATPATPAVTPSVVTPAAPAAAEMKIDTVEQRITELHNSLKITHDQEKKWTAVATDMRDNAVAMDKLVATEKSTPAASKTAVYDLKMYQKFSQAHVDGLKNLLSSFESLYASMSDSQKKIADDIFQASGRQGGASRG